MTTSEGPTGLVVICRRDETIEQVVYWGLAEPAAIPVGSSFLDLLDRGSRTKGRAFLQAVRGETASFGWELCPAPVSVAPRTLLFMGALHGERLLVTATTLGHAAEYAGPPGVFRQTVGRDDSLMEEVSRMNNGLVTLHRKVARRNAELARKNAELDEKSAALETALANIQ